MVKDVFAEVDRSRSVGSHFGNLYVSRPVLNGLEIVRHFQKAGIDPDLFRDTSEFHVTLAYSTQKVDWARIQPQHDRVEIPSQYRQRGMQEFGREESVIVLTLGHPEVLRSRFDEFLQEGASYDFPEYNPHITLADGPYEGVWHNIDNVFEGPIILGPECFDIIRDT